jgi:archaellum component FlaC
MERLNAWASRIRVEMKKLDASKIKYNIDLEDIRKRDHDILAQLDTIRTADANQRKQIETLRDRIKELHAELSMRKARCRDIQKATTNPANEKALHYCNAIVRADPSSATEPKN